MALTVSVVSVGAAGASTIGAGTAPMMSLADRAAVAAVTAQVSPARAASGHADQLRRSRPVSRSGVVRAAPTPAPDTTASTRATDVPKTSPPRPVAPPSWTCPIAGCGGRFTSPFGVRWGSRHLGDDFATPVGTPLHALHAATVVAAGRYGGMGNRIEVDFGHGIHAVYAHLSRIDVAVGEHVRMGAVIGRSGNTGHSTGPHLHLEIHLNGTPVDPAPWLRAHHIF